VTGPVPAKIISGGQTGADRAALDFALAHGIAIGGWVPRGRLAEDGIIADRYAGLVETASSDPAERTVQNVRDSDATLIVSHGPLAGGSLLAFEEARRAGKLLLHLDLDALGDRAAAARLRGRLAEARPTALNVAGPRASEDPRIAAATDALLRAALRCDGAAYWPSPWPAEDGGPRRSQAPAGLAGIVARPDCAPTVVHRDALGATMLVLRARGELFALRHTMPARPEQPCTAWVERLDPETLATLARSPDLEAGPFWPGGLACHANGSLYVVFGNHAHRLSADLTLLRSHELPRLRPYNSFVLLANGLLVTKDFDHATHEPALLSVLDPETLAPACEPVPLPEPSIARLSADGDVVYAAGDHTLFRLAWNGRTLVRDGSWSHRYRTYPDQSYAWDVVLEGGHAWFMDQGAHDYAGTMLGAGVAAGPIRLFRVSLADARDHDSVEVSRQPRGTCTNPPLYDPERRIAVGYDSGNGVIAAWRHTEAGALEPLWQRPLATAGHLIRFPDTGAILAYDFRAPAVFRTRAFRAVAQRIAPLAARPAARRALSRATSEDVVLLDVTTGEERARASIPTMFQSVVFPAPGWANDLYYCSFSTIARVAF
jgi:putative molybdenum carrier protein